MVLTLLKRLDSHTKEIVERASMALLIKISAAVLNFSLSVVLARLLGAEGAGIYFLSFTVVTITAMISRLGLDNALLKFVASSVAEENWQAVKGVYQRSISLVLVSSLLVALGLFLLAPWLSYTVFKDSNMLLPLRFMALANIGLALFTLNAQALKGLKHVASALSVQSLWVAIFTLVGILLWIPQWGVLGAIWAYVIASFITLAIGLISWWRATPQLRGVRGSFEVPQLLNSSVPLFWMSTLQMVTAWGSTFMLGIWLDSAQVGIYESANRTAFLTSFILVAVNSISAPKFAALYKKGDMKALASTARVSAQIMAVAAAPILFVFLFFPYWVMNIFGSEFSSGASVLSILAIGQYISVATGSVGFLLMMCGYERLMRNNIFICALVLVFLNIILIPSLGIQGAAIASATTVILQNMIAAYFVLNKLGIRTLPNILQSLKRLSRRKS